VVEQATRTVLFSSAVVVEQATRTVLFSSAVVVEQATRAALFLSAAVVEEQVARAALFLSAVVEEQVARTALFSSEKKVGEEQASPNLLSVQVLPQEETTMQGQKQLLPPAIHSCPASIPEYSLLLRF
jgi:hypothetical protein